MQSSEESGATTSPLSQRESVLVSKFSYKFILVISPCMNARVLPAVKNLYHVN